MKILALDTSCIAATAAVLEDRKILAEYTTNHKKTHSQKLLPMIDEMFKALELSPKEIDIFAASVGPGSFTGLRIGIVTIKGFAYALDKPVISIPTLDAMAYQIPQTSALIYPIIDARNRQVYTAPYRWEGRKQVRCGEYVGIEIEKLMEIIKKKSKEVIFVGDAVLLHEDFFYDSLKSQVLFADPALYFNRASSVALLAYIKYQEGFMESSFSLKPFYLRKSQAERMKEIRNVAKNKVM